MAYHWAAAGDQTNALAASVRAGLEAHQVGALGDAAAHFERAVELWPNIADAEVLAGFDEPTLFLRAAAARGGSGSTVRAVALAESAVALLAPAQPERRAAALERLGHHRWAAGDRPGARDARQEAVALVVDRPPSQVQAVALFALGRQLMVELRHLDAEPALRRALTVAETTGAHGVRATALAAISVVLSSLGRINEGLAAADMALKVAEQHGTADEISHTYVNATLTKLLAKRYDDAGRLTLAGLEHARRFGMLASDGTLLSDNAAEALYFLGRWDDALDMIIANRSAIAGVYGMDGAIVAARIALRRGRVDDAVLHADQALTAARPATDFEAFICAAEVAAHRGSFADARRYAATAVESIVSTDAMHLAARTCATAVAIEADRVEAARLGGRPSQTDVDLARALADGLVARTRDTIERLAGTGVAVLADTSAWMSLGEAHRARVHGHDNAEQWADVAARFDALTVPYEAAIARYHEADARLRSRNDHQLATAAARAALAAGEQLGATPLVEQVRLLAQRGRLDLSESPQPAAQPDPLQALGISQREAEVLALLGLGRTNRQIGEELYISGKDCQRPCQPSHPQARGHQSHRRLSHRTTPPAALNPLTPSHSFCSSVHNADKCGCGVGGTQVGARQDGSAQHAESSPPGTG